MTKTTVPTNPYPNVAPPAGAQVLDEWQPAQPRPYRVAFGADRTVTDHTVTVSTDVAQRADGTTGDAYVRVLDHGSRGLNSDQARELAAVLLEAAAEVDGWAARRPRHH